MSELFIAKEYTFNNVNQFIERFNLKRIFKKNEGVDIKNFKSYIEDAVLIRKYAGIAFPENFWCMSLDRELEKIVITIFK